MKTFNEIFWKIFTSKKTDKVINTILIITGIIFFGQLIIRLIIN